MTEIPETLDLLGGPPRPTPSKRGRRKLRFPEEVYDRVEVLAATGTLTQDEIADAVGVSAPTLRKYFRPELGKAEARQRAEALSILQAEARKGKGWAVKAWLAELDKSRASAALKAREKPEANAVRLGVKDQRQAAAGKVGAAGGKYAPPPAPRLAVDNTGS